METGKKLWEKALRQLCTCFHSSCGRRSSAQPANPLVLREQPRREAARVGHVAAADRLTPLQAHRELEM
jgi:hypothetical protein